MGLRIICDSSSNTFELPGTDYSLVPLTVRLGKHDFVDTKDLDLPAFWEAMSLNKEKSATTCPSPQTWLDAYRDADRVLAITLSAKLSGSYNAACVAASEYQEKHPETEVVVFNSRSAGEELFLFAQKAYELSKLNPEATLQTIKTELEEYQKHTHVLFTISDLSHLAQSGRINPTLVHIAHTLDIQLLGTGTDQGTIELLRKCRGQRKVFRALIHEMQMHHYQGGTLYISYVHNKEAAETLAGLIQQTWSEAEPQIQPCHALCSFYANLGGLIVSYVDSKTAPLHPFELPPLPIGPLKLFNR